MCGIAVVVFNVTGGSGWHLSSCGQTNFRTMTFSYNASREMMCTGKLSVYCISKLHMTKVITRCNFAPLDLPCDRSLHSFGIMSAHYDVFPSASPPNT